MVRHNNMIPHQHFHKKWQKLARPIFNQPAKKKARVLARSKRVNKLSPRPVNWLRPSINCPSFRYNSKKRLGRGFTLLELKKLNLNKRYARTIGITVDYRRKNRSVETLRANVNRLGNYLGKLIVYPVSNKVVPKTLTRVPGLKKPENHVRVMEPSEELRKFEAYVTLRKARSEKKSKSRNLKRKKKTDALDLEAEFKK